MFQIAICDNDKRFCESLKECLETLIDRLNVEYDILVWNKCGEFIEFLLEKNKVDLLFLEIELDECSGISIGKFIRENLSDFKTQLVYVSSKQGYAMQLFETEPMDFLIKTIHKEQVEKVIKRFLKKQLGMQNAIIIRQGHGNIQIPYSSICYFQSMNHKIVVHTIDGQNEFYSKLTNVENEVPECFIRIHKSYLVNEAFISSFHYDNVVLKNNQKLPISRSYRSIIRKKVIQNDQNIVLI